MKIQLRLLLFTLALSTFWLNILAKQLPLCHNNIANGTLCQNYAYVDHGYPPKPWPLRLKPLIHFKYIPEVNEDMETITLILYFHISWTDPRISAKNQLWKHIDHQDGIWYPKIQFDLKFDLHPKKVVGQVGVEDRYFWLNSDEHYLEYGEEIQVTIGCDLDFSKFPFDVNVCDLIIAEFVIGFPLRQY